MSPLLNTDGQDTYGCSRLFIWKLDMRKIILLAALVVATSAQAEEIVKCNEHGASVTLTDGTVLYLGKQCDAAREGGGAGYWWNAASFLGVEIDGKAYMVAEGRGIDCLPFCSLPD